MASESDLRFIVRLVLDESERAAAAIAKESQGRGASLLSLLAISCSRIEATANGIASRLPSTNAGSLAADERELYRLRDELALIHEMLGHYSGDFGRRDIPVGLIRLIDELVTDLLPKGADPVVHLNPARMYSTLPIVELARQLWGGSVPAEPHPVVFNLPALNPANVLLSPILAHEVGHTGWRQGLNSQVDGCTNLSKASAHLRSVRGTDPKELAKLFDGWRQELLCDSLAAILTGPSFLFAMAVFLPATATSYVLGTHPHPRFRLALALKILKRQGWEPLLTTELPKVYGWLTGLAGAIPHGSSTEVAVRQAIGEIEDTLISIALGAVKKPLLPDRISALLSEFSEFLEIEVPPVRVGQCVPSPWELLAGTWIYELKRLGDSGEALASACFDPDLNAFLVKTIELAGMLSLWGEF